MSIYTIYKIIKEKKIEKEVENSLTTDNIFQSLMEQRLPLSAPTLTGALTTEKLS